LFSVLLSDGKNTRTVRFNTGLARYTGLTGLTDNADTGDCSYLVGKVANDIGFLILNIFPAGNAVKYLSH
jgi:hypothetical protein